MKINRKFTRIMGVGLSAAMLASTVLTAVPVMALTSPTVTMNNTGVSQNSSWDIRFTINTAISGTGNITLTWPSGFSINQTTTNVSAANGYIADATIAAGPGWTGTSTFGDPTITIATINATAATRKVRIEFAASDVIGADAQVRIILPAGVVTNPSTAGTYNITVATSNETTAVTSANFVITLPNIGPLPGQVEGKNSNGDVLYRNIVSDLSTVIATPGVSRIELASGTYNASNTAGTLNQTIIGVGAAGTVILTAPAGSVPLTVSATNVVIENLTIQGNGNGVDDLVDATANSTFRNVTFSGGVNQLDISSSTVQAFTVSNCTFSVTGNVSRGIRSASANASQVQLNVTNSSFTVDASGDAIVSTSNLTLSNSTFTGSSTSPDGVLSSNGTSTITNNTFTNLTRAIVVSGNTTITATLNGTIVTATENTFTGNGATSASSSAGAIECSGGELVLLNNTINDIGSIYYALHVSGGNLTARFNNITGNPLNVRQTSGTANATLNWWGSSDGPAVSSLNATTAALLDTTPYLTGAASNGVIAYNSTNLTARNTAGVDVSTANGSYTYATAARYAANPQNATPVGNPIAYYDVSLGVTPGSEPGSISIRFYGAVTENTKVYYGGGLTGAWSLAGTQGVNTASGFAFVTITGTSSPAYSDMGGTPFVITDIVSAPAAPTLLGPAAGTTGIPVNTGFSWSPVTGATSYNFQVSTDPNFATTVANGDQTVTSTVAGGVTLATNTTYFWRVRAVNSGGSSVWSSSTFTTVAPAAVAPPVITPPPAVTVNVTPPAPVVNVTPTAPVVNVAPAQVTVQPPNVTVNPPQVTVTAPPPANVTVNPPQVTITPPPPAQVTVNNTPPSPVIPTYILWTIILIGAVLIIALIVLIVRTRRVA